MKKLGDLFDDAVTEIQPSNFKRKSLDVFRAEQMPLIEVLEHLECYVKQDKDYRPRKDLSSRRYWIVPPAAQKQYEVIITGSYWYDTRSNKGNFGIFNLVMHIFKESYVAARDRIEGKPRAPKKPKTQELQLLQFYTVDYLSHLPLKDDKYTMEFPFFALKAGDMKPRLYKAKGVSVMVKPGYDGLATIDDKDLWIFAISHLVAAKNRGDPISRTVRFTAANFLKSVGKPISGVGYQWLKDALDRLKGTVIKTNIKTPGYQENGWFGLLDSAVMIKDENGKTVAVEMVLPDWLMCSIKAPTPHVLTLSPDYFKIKKPLARRIYELVRKHCGPQRSWKVSLQILHEKSGSIISLLDFRKQVRKIVQENNLPDYKMLFNAEKDQVIFLAREVEKLTKKAKKTV